MKRQLALTLLSTLTLTAAMLGSSPPAAATVSSPPVPDGSLTMGFAAIATEFGNLRGNIVITSSTGQTKVLARGLSSMVVYTAGDGIYSSDRFSFCSQASTGGLDSCVELDLSAGGGGTEFECTTEYPGDNWCECYNPEDCLKLIFSDSCDESLTCGDYGVCACTTD